MKNCLYLQGLQIPCGGSLTNAPKGKIFGIMPLTTVPGKQCLNASSQGFANIFYSSLIFFQCRFAVIPYIFRRMKQSLYNRLKFYKNAAAHNRRHTAFNNKSYRESLNRKFPRVRSKFFRWSYQLLKPIPPSVCSKQALLLHFSYSITFQRKTVIFF